MTELELVAAVLKSDMDDVAKLALIQKATQPAVAVPLYTVTVYPWWQQPWTVNPMITWTGTATTDPPPNTAWPTQ